MPDENLVTGEYTSNDEFADTVKSLQRIYELGQAFSRFNQSAKEASESIRRVTDCMGQGGLQDVWVVDTEGVTSRTQVRHVPQTSP